MWSACALFVVFCRLVNVFFRSLNASSASQSVGELCSRALLSSLGGLRGELSDDLSNSARTAEQWRTQTDFSDELRGNFSAQVFCRFTASFQNQNPPKQSQSSGTGTAQPKKTKNRRSGFVFYAGKTCSDTTNKAKPCPNSNSHFSALLVTASTERGKQKPAFFCGFSAFLIFRILNCLFFSFLNLLTNIIHIFSYRIVN